MLGVNKWAGVAAAMLLSTTAMASAELKVTSISGLSQLPTPLPYPFHEDANADSQVADALAQAKAAHKLAFIDLGANWCADCRVLAGVMDLPEVRRFVDAHYVVAQIDVGRLNRNLQVPARWGIPALPQGVPTVLIVDPNSDKLVDQGHVTVLVDARHMTPQQIADWLAKWVH
ncbi:MAG TPA: thioredoxin family protein [Rhizomicrobium sp.]|jgi:thiol:disulfide interchange protein